MRKHWVLGDTMDTISKQSDDLTNCTTTTSAKMFALSLSDRPENWNEHTVLEQAKNVKPCCISIEQAIDNLMICVESPLEGELFFKVSLAAAGYQVHSDTWHSVHLPDERRFGLSLFGDNLQEFLDILFPALAVIKKGCDNPDGPGGNYTVKHFATSANKKKLKLDVAHATSLDDQHSASGFSSISIIPDAMAALGSVNQGAVGELVERLQQAVAGGDADAAQQVARQLANIRVSLDVNVNAADPDLRDKEIPVKIYIEDQQSSGGHIILYLKPSTKIMELKMKILIKYNLAPELQNWIIGKRIATDGQTLEQCGVTVDNAPVFLYLSSSRAVGLTKEVFTQRYGKLVKANKLAGPEQPPRQMSWSAGPPPTTNPGPAASPSALTTLQQGIADIAMTSATPPPTPRPETPSTEVSKHGWACPRCTLELQWSRLSCTLCNADRPAEMKPPPDAIITPEEQARLAEAQVHEEQAKQMVLVGWPDEADRAARFSLMVEADEQDLIPNDQGFNCGMCMDDVSTGQGIMLKECLHTFCRECLAALVKHTELAEVRCPFRDGDITCSSSLQHREIKALVDDEAFEHFLQRSVQLMEHHTQNSYHCKTANCTSWCISNGTVDKWKCPVCEAVNCLTCKAIHESLSCLEYQRDLELNFATNEDSRRTNAVIKGLLKSGKAMQCPACKVVIQKKEGCDWMQCSMCLTEICWVTGGPRWGPEGEGDKSGGCHCLEDGVTRCSPNCVNCH